MINKTQVYIGVMVLSEIITQYFLQKGVKGNMSLKNTNLILGLIIGFFINVFYFLVLKSGFSLAIANTLIDGGGALGIVILGYLVFKQKLSYKQILAVVVTMVGVLMLGIFE
jgi:multidrug transporter EmrE-like cation transporter